MTATTTTAVVVATASRSSRITIRARTVKPRPEVEVVTGEVITIATETTITTIAAGAVAETTIAVRMMVNHKISEVSGIEFCGYFILFVIIVKERGFNDIINNIRYLGILIETKLLKMRSTRLAPKRFYNVN